MKTQLAISGIFLLLTVMLVPAYAEVNSFDLAKNFYTDEEGFIFEGTSDSNKASVFVIIRDEDGDYKGMVSDPSSDDDGSFQTIGRQVEDIFSRSGVYFATAFTDDEKEKDGLTIEVEYDGSKLFLVPNFDLNLKTISNKTIEEEKTLSFTAGVTEALSDLEYSLERNPPSGASINSETGQFTWRPTSNQAPGSYAFDIVVKKGGLEDRESIIVTVTEKPVVQQQPTTQQPTTQQPTTPEPPKELGLAPFVDESKDPQSYVDRYNNEPSYKEWFDDNYPEYSSIYQAVGLEEPLLIPAVFVDEAKDPQSYVDRYNNEPSYKEWFDDNYPEYSSIYQAVGLEEPVETPAFVDPNQDPQYYVDRYNNEPSYKEWFDDNYPEYSSIYQAVGLEDPNMVKDDEEEEKIGECGTGTILVNGVCTPDESAPANNNDNGGGCLIATAAYGSEMSPQVQILREIRDGKVMNTQSGASFMTGFNSLYYSFSPYIADYQRENPAFKEIVKIGITPMLSTLSIMSLADTESEIVGYGIGVILLNLGMYVAAPAMILAYGINKARSKRVRI